MFLFCLSSRELRETYIILPILSSQSAEIDSQGENDYLSFMANRDLNLGFHSPCLPFYYKTICI